MTPANNAQSDARQHAADLGRWDDEGGAVPVGSNKRTGKAKKYRRPMREIDNKQKDS
jgi:hypothetical protein